MRFKYLETEMIHSLRMKASPNQNLMSILCSNPSHDKNHCDNRHFHKRKSGDFKLFFCDSEFNVLFSKNVEGGNAQSLKRCIIQWSHDSNFLLLLNPPASFVFIFNVQKKSVERVNFSAPLLTLITAPANNYFATILEFQLKLEISIIGKRMRFFIKTPKLGSSDGMSFSKSGAHFAVVEKVECADIIAIYDVDNLFKIFSRFKAATEDCVRIEWSSELDLICVLDSNLSSKVLVYNIEGLHLMEFGGGDQTGFLNTVSWAPRGSILINSDQNGNIFFSRPLFAAHPFLTFPSETIFRFFRAASRTEHHLLPKVFLEVPWDYIQGQLINDCREAKTKFITRWDKEVVSPITRHFEKWKNDKSDSRNIRFSWQKDSLFVAFVIADRIVLVLDMTTLSVAVVIVTRQKVASLTWRNCELFFCCNSVGLYVWTESNCNIVEGNQTKTRKVEVFGDEVLLVTSKGVILRGK